MRMQSGEAYETKEMPAGDHYINVALDEVVFFIRRNKLLPLAVPADCVDHMTNDYSYLSYIREAGEYLLYEDDGYSRNYDDESHFTRLVADQTGKVTVAK